MQRVTGGFLATTLGLVLSSSGCGFLEDRFKSCDDVRVDLVNDDQTLGPFHIVAEEERPGPENLLQSGDARRISQCLDKGYRKEFRVFRPNDFSAPIANAKCAASHTSYESIVPRVRWTPIGIICDNW